MAIKQTTTKTICPHCKKVVKLGIKKWGDPSPRCPVCGEQVLTWLDGDYNMNFLVAGGTGAQREGLKRFGGHKPL